MGGFMNDKRFWGMALGLLCVCVFLLLWQTTVAKADDVYASIRGTVTDSTGSIVPDVTLTATNIGTSISRTAVSSKDGSYAFLQLGIGDYTVSAEKTGFSKFVTSKIHLDADQVYDLPVKLVVGAITTEVTVEAKQVEVETTSMQLGDVITGQEIVDAPLVNRNWVQLQQIQPGVVGTSDRFNTGNYATNGSESQQNSFLINGMDSSDIALNTPNILPSPDALSEFRVVTSTINPEYGRNSGAILSAAIKSGTDSFHGDAFWFYRDTSLNGRSFFQATPSIYHQNLFGGTIGGPVWKKHTFFFFSYQGSRFTQPQTFALPTVPPAAETGGDFSASPCAVAGTCAFIAKSTKSSAIPLFGDSASPCPVSAGTPCVAGTPYAKLFSTNVIPTQDFNTVAAGLATKFVPAPNFGTNKFTFNPTEAGKTDQYLFRIDQTFNSRDSIWFYGLFESDPRTDTLPFVGGTLPGFGETQKVHDKEFVGAWQHLLGSDILNEFRMGYQRLNFDAVVPETVTPPSSVGFSGINPQNLAAAGIPLVTVTGQDSNFALGFSQFGPQPRVDEIYQAGDSLSLVHGKHTIKFGFEGRRFEVHNPFFSQNNGSFTFGSTGPFSTGNSYADFLLGVPDNYVQSSGNIIDARAYELYSYVQDQLKLKPNLTLTYGIGWDINTPLSNLTNHGLAINCFTPFQQSTVFPTAPQGLLFPGDQGCNSSGYTTHYNDFGPRVGLAWSPDWGWISGGPGKLSIRAGFGLYYNRGEEELTLQFLTDPPFGLGSGGIGGVGGSPSFAAPFTDARCISQSGNPIAGGLCAGLANPSIPNPFPFTAPKPGAAVNWASYEPFGLATIDPNFRAPYAENYNVTIQRELPSQTILTVAWVGSMGHRLETWLERNPGQPGQCAAVAACVGNPFNEWQAPYNLQPFHQFDSTVFGSIGTMSSLGHSNYNAFEVNVNKHVSHGLNFIASYTYSHALDNSSSFEDRAFNGLGMDPFNLNRYYGSSSYDARQRLVIDYSYLIPKIPGTTSNGILDKVVNGWRIAGITTFQTGLPVTVYNQVAGVLGTSSGTCPGTPVETVFVSCWDTVNFNGPLVKENPRAPGNLWFNTSAFSMACAPVLIAAGTCTGTPITNPQTGGDAGRNFFHGPGIQQWDFQLTKVFQITESKSIQLRAEVYNIFNHANFGNIPSNGGPDGNLADGPGAFGVITGIQGLPREVQLAAKFYF
jgi:hypothetical protein